MPDPAKVLADFKPEGGPRVIAARDPRRAEVGVRRPAGTGEGPEAAGELSRTTRRRPTGRPTSWWWPTATSWPTGSGCASPTSSASKTATPFSDNGAVRRQPDRHARRRRRADRAALARRHQPSVHPGERDAERGGSQIPPDPAGAAEAPRRHRKAASHAAPGIGGGEQASAQAVITPEQRAAIDAARKDIVDTRAAVARRAARI